MMLPMTQILELQKQNDELRTKLAAVERERDQWVRRADKTWHEQHLLDKLAAVEREVLTYAQEIGILRDKLAAAEKERDSLKLDAAIGRVPLDSKDFAWEERLASTEALLAQYRKVLECMGPTPHAPNLTKQMYHAALAQTCSTTALNNAIAAELERMAEFVPGGYEAELLRIRAKELRQS